MNELVNNPIQINLVYIYNLGSSEVSVEMLSSRLAILRSRVTVSWRRGRSPPFSLHTGLGSKVVPRLRECLGKARQKW